MHLVIEELGRDGRWRLPFAALGGDARPLAGTPGASCQRFLRVPVPCFQGA